MLSIFKIVLASALAVFAFVVVASSASAAPSWSVAGTKVATGEKFTIAEAATLSVENRLIYKAFGLEITCAGVNIKSGWVEGETKGGAEHIVLTGCIIPRPEDCEVVGGKITLGEVRFHLLPSEALPEVAFEPLNSTVFASLKFKTSHGGTCVVNGKEFKMAGHMNASIPELGTEAIFKEIKFDTGAGELTLNSEELDLAANLSLELSLSFIWGIA